MTDDTIEYIMKPKKVKPPRLWGENKPYECYPYILNIKNLRSMIQKPATESAFVRDFSMKYDDKASEIQPVSVPSKSKVCYKIYFIFCLPYFILRIEPSLYYEY